MTWLADRRPEVPEEFRGYLGHEALVGGAVDDLTQAATESMRAALEHPGRDRVAAFHLLAADAYASYACEAASESSDPESALREILRRFQGVEVG